MSLPGRLIKVGGLRLFVHESGPPTSAAPPLLLLHGWLLSHWQWRHVIGALVASGHRVVALDLPGFGESDRPSPREFRYDYTTLADTVLSALDVLEIPRAAVMGTCLGGGVALVAAARRPERIERLVLVDSAAYPWELPLEARIALLPVAGTFLFRAVVTRRMVRSIMSREMYADPALVTDEWVDYVWERANRANGVEAALATLDELATPDVATSSARAVRAPSLVVHGALDRVFPADHARRLAADIGCQAHLIPGCGHSPAEEKPAELCSVVLPFLAAEGQLARSA